MPTNVGITEEEEEAFEQGGGLKDRTKQERERVFQEFAQVFLRELKKTIPEQYAEDPELVSKTFNKYFWTMNVSVSVCV